MAEVKIEKKEEVTEVDKKDEKVIKPIVSTPAKVKKKNAFEKAVDGFISEDAKHIKEYVVGDVLIPAAKKAISDVITNGIDMLLYGKNGGRSSSRIPAQRVSYQSYYDRDRYSYNSSRPVERPRAYSFDDIILQTRGEADAVLNEMDNIIRKYGFVKVADLYDLVGLTGSYTDNNYGWTSLKDASIRRVNDGFLLVLPRPMEID